MADLILVFLPKKIKGICLPYAIKCVFGIVEAFFRQKNHVFTLAPSFFSRKI
jgi:hypothetical protein